MNMTTAVSTTSKGNFESKMNEIEDAICFLGSKIDSMEARLATVLRSEPPSQVAQPGLDQAGTSGLADTLRAKMA